jgi:hypothetical protein
MFSNELRQLSLDESGKYILTGDPEISTTNTSETLIPASVHTDNGVAQAQLPGVTAPKKKGRKKASPTHDNHMATNGKPSDNQRSPQVRVGKLSEVESKVVDSRVIESKAVDGRTDESRTKEVERSEAEQIVPNSSRHISMRDPFHPTDSEINFLVQESNFSREKALEWYKNTQAISNPSTWILSKIDIAIDQHNATASQSISQSN